jgi:hypothetical protein
MRNSAHTRMQSSYFSWLPRFASSWKMRVDPSHQLNGIPETKLFQTVTAIRLKIAHGIIAETTEFQRAEWE